MQRKKIRVNDWLSGECPYKGCLHNDSFGSCHLEDTDFVDEMLDTVHKSYKENRLIPEDEVFVCANADFDTAKCEKCGSGLKEYKDYPTGEKQFMPVIYEICSNKECEESAI